jgi:hypothetical protein
MERFSYAATVLAHNARQSRLCCACVERWQWPGTPAGDGCLARLLTCLNFTLRAAMCLIS